MRLARAVAVALIFGCAAAAVLPKAGNGTHGVTSHWYFDHWSQGACAGPNRKTYTPYNTCEGNPRAVAGGSVAYAPAIDAPTATIQMFKSSDCNGTAGITANIVCGQCVNDPLDSFVGYYIWKCNVKAQYVTRQIQCNSDCSVCPPADIIGVSGCVSIPQGEWGSLGLPALAHGRWTQATVYTENDTTCSGNSTTAWTQCDACIDQGTKLDCS